MTFRILLAVVLVLFFGGVAYLYRTDAVLVGISIGGAFVLFILLNTVVVQPLRDLMKTLKLYAEKGERVQLPKVSHAVSEIKSLAYSFGMAMNRVEESHQHDTEISRVKSDFISTAAHQLRTPLTGVRWALEALEKEPLNENQLALVKSAVDKSHDLVNIVGTLLDISAIESGKYKYTFAPVNMVELAREVVNDFMLLAQKKSVLLSYSETEFNSIVARADRDRIKWLLNNLVENAIIYTPSGGSVQVFVEQIENRVLVRVKDTGIGIPTKDRSSIFERFYRAQNAISHENAGNGLGLYIARTIATDHEGDLTFVENSNGIGTTFILSLPLPH